LIERLNEGLNSGRKLTLISASTGFGKTTVVSEWVAACERSIAWLSLDEGDNDPSCFLTYVVAALQTISASIGVRVLGLLQSPQPPPTESILTTLINDISTIPDNFILVLDDYHVIDAKPIENALTFLVRHLPPQMHLVIATREDPPLPLARLRARGQLTELRAADLRFTPTEAADYLNHVMGLNLSTENIAVLETRTEGWIAGLQLAALAFHGMISMQGYQQQDLTRFIKAFTGSHHFVMDYLVEEVLHQQSEGIQSFLLRTSILNRLCGSLCDAVLLDPSVSGKDILEYLERANLFLFPLDDERRWYRYHHLFADLLRMRLQQSITSIKEYDENLVNELHNRASRWYEEHGLYLEAFHHAGAAHNVESAERLIEGKEIPLYFSGAAATVLEWFASLPEAVMNAKPSLWWKYASLLLINGQTIGVEEKIQAAEAAIAATGLQDSGSNSVTRNLIGQFAAARATLALTRYDVDSMFAQSSRALEFLHPNSLSSRSTALWTQGYAYLLQGDRVAARQAFTEAIMLSQSAGALFTTILSTIGLGNVQELENQLYLAEETYLRVLKWVGDQPQQIIHEAHLGLARIHYEWNDLHVAEQHGRQSLYLARQYETVIDRFILCEVFLARLKLAQGDAVGASVILSQANLSVHQRNFLHRIPEVASAQVLVLLRQGNLAEAAKIAQASNLPVSQARVYLAQRNPAAALAILEPLHRQAKAKSWLDDQLKMLVLKAIALYALGERDRAVQALGEALVLAEPGGFTRTFIDEGTPITHLLSFVKTRGMMTDYAGRLLAAFETESKKTNTILSLPADSTLIDPLSQRELEILRLIARGYSNDEICEQLFLAMSTVKGHNRNIYDKLQVQRRTEAVARARELGLL
jgi:LuxR family maltose regulon positive regulatory protein